MRSVSQYLNFKGNTEEAFEFYKSVFGGELTGVIRFRDFGDNSMNVSEADLDKVAHISLPLVGDVSLMASDVVGPQASDFVAGNNIYIYLEMDTTEEIERIFSALSDGGSVVMPLQGTEWAESYGMCVDRFGIQWMLSYEGSVQYPG